MNKKNTFFIISILLIIIASGCTKRQCVEADYATFQPILDYPPDGGTVSFDGPWTFDWHHDEPCEPFSYLVRVYDSDNHPMGGQRVYGPTSELTVDLDYFISPSDPIYPGTEYFWNVLPEIEQDLPGKVSELKEDGQISQTFSFFTDGICESGEAVTPQLENPEDGSWANTSFDPPEISISWSNIGDCVPEEFQYQVATDPGFNHIVLTGKTDFISTFALVPVPNCTHLYWRVRSAVGDSTSAWSEPYSFYYASDSYCWLLDSPSDAALIKGYVFEDKCTGTMTFESDSNAPVPPCTSSQYGIHGDGIWNFAANQEPGIKDVLVELGSSHCPDVGSDQFLTLDNGMYYFTPQVSGEYCVSVSKADNSQLEEGIWTLPLTDKIITQQTIIIGLTDEEINQNFGWDKNEFKKLNYTVDILTTCRQTDNKNSQPVMYLEEGSVVPVVATNEGKTWYLTEFNCFVSIATGEAEEGDLPLYPEQPIPVIDDQAVPGQTDTAKEKPCSSYTSPRSCVYPRCTWVYPIAGPGYCKESD